MHAPEHLRVIVDWAPTEVQTGNDGFFLVPTPNPGGPLRVMSGDGLGWEHVSVSCERRTPTWAEMQFVKTLWWDDDQAVMQLHPPQSEWVNNHDYCLHLWRPKDIPIPLPPSWMVGDKTKTPDDVEAMVKGTQP